MVEQNGYVRPELVCPAGTPAGLRTAVDAGADAVYCGLQNATNARNFPGLNFTPAELKDSISYAHARNAKVLLAVNTFPPAGRFDLWREAVDLGAALGADALIVADMEWRPTPRARIQISGCISPCKRARHRRRQSNFTVRNLASSAWCCRAS